MIKRFFILLFLCVFLSFISTNWAFLLFVIGIIWVIAAKGKKKEHSRGNSVAQSNRGTSSTTTKNSSANIFFHKISFSDFNAAYWDYRIDGQHLSYQTFGGSGAVAYRLNRRFKSDSYVYSKGNDEGDSKYERFGKVQDYLFEHDGENWLVLKMH